MMSTQTSSPTLLERVAAGEADAFTETVKKYGDLVWSLALRFTRTHSDAEDAVQDIYTAIWQSAHRYNPRMGNEVTFVSVLARRRLIDRWRRDSRGPEREEIEWATAASTSERDGFAGGDADAAMTAFENLNDRQRTALRFSMGFGLTHEKIAVAMGIPLGTVKTTIRKGLQRVRASVDSRSFREESFR